MKPQVFVIFSINDKHAEKNTGVEQCAVIPESATDVFVQHRHKK
ncbi:MAG: hypothetical protein ACOYLR_10550 [Chlorobium sp.]